MSWFFLATISYFFGALTIILDKYLLKSEKISSPPVYAFYVGLTGMGVLIFAPLGLLFNSFQLKIPNVFQIGLSFFSGIFFLASILALYFAIKKAEASKVTPVVFSVTPLVALFLSSFVGLEKFGTLGYWGIALLIVGGLLISFDLPLKINKRKFFDGFYLSLLSGFLMGISIVALKFVYLYQNFFNGFVWSRGGALIGALLLLTISPWRKGIVKSFANAGKNKKENVKTGGLFVFNKILGGSSSALYNLAIGAGSVTLVSSMVSLQYVFVLIIAVIAGKKLPHIFEERLYFWDWFQKIAAIMVIAVGMFFVSR